MNWISTLLSDETGSASSKRLVGVLCALVLCGALIASAYGHHADSTLTGEVLALAVAALGLTSYDKRTPPSAGVTP